MDSAGTQRNCMLLIVCAILSKTQQTEFFQASGVSKVLRKALILKNVGPKCPTVRFSVLLALAVDHQRPA